MVHCNLLMNFATFMEKKIPGQLSSGFRFFLKLSGFTYFQKFFIQVTSKLCLMMIKHVRDVFRTSGSGFLPKSGFVKTLFLKSIHLQKFFGDKFFPDKKRDHSLKRIFRLVPITFYIIVCLIKIFLLLQYTPNQYYIYQLQVTITIKLLMEPK